MANTGWATIASPCSKCKNANPEFSFTSNRAPNFKSRFCAHVLKLSTKIPVVATMKQLNNSVEMKPAGHGTFVT